MNPPDIQRQDRTPRAGWTRLAANAAELVFSTIVAVTISACAAQSSGASLSYIWPATERPCVVADPLPQIVACVAKATAPAPRESPRFYRAGTAHHAVAR